MTFKDGLKVNSLELLKEQSRSSKEDQKTSI